MITAKVQTARKFYHLFSSANPNKDLQLVIYTDAGVVSSTNAATASAVVLGLYSTAGVIFAAEGSYYYVWQDVDDPENPVILVSGQLVVVNDPIADFSTGVARKYRYEAPALDETIVDLVLTIYDSAGDAVATESAAAIAGLDGIYETASQIALATEGVYAFIWTSVLKGFAYTQLQAFVVLPSPDTRKVTTYVIDQSVSPQVPLDGVTVLVSKTDGTPLFKSVTDSYGKALFSLRNGDYVVSIQKSGITYSKNNLAVTVVDVTDTTPNVYYLFATPFAAAFDDSPLITTDKKSLMTVDLVDMSGEAMCGIHIIISSHLVPDTATGSLGTVGVMEAHRKITTDGAGHAEVYLLRGAKVVVAFEGTSIRRTITVPAQATFNLLDIATEDGDPFDINILDIATGIRRSI